MKLKRYLALVLSATMVLTSSIPVMANELEPENVIISEVVEEIAEETDVIEETLPVAEPEEDIQALKAKLEAEFSDETDEATVDVTASEEATVETTAETTAEIKAEAVEPIGDFVADEDEIEAAKTAAVNAGYVISDEMKQLKSEVKGDLVAYNGIVEGKDCAAKQVMTLADTEEDAEKIAKMFGATISSYAYGVLVLDLPENKSVASVVALSVRADNDLPAVTPNFYRHSESTPITNFDEFTFASSGIAYQYHHDVIGSKAAWEAGFTGEGIVVAVLDCGINTDHTELDGREVSVTPFKPYAGTEKPEEYTEFKDMAGHGTHVCSTIVGNNNDVYGMGVAPGAKYINVKVLNDLGSGLDDMIIKGLNYVAEQNNVDIINMSLGSIVPNALYSSALFKLRNQGVAIFASAGNEGGKGRNYPASYDGVISVASTDEVNERSYFSQYGTNVDVAAPGSNILSAYCDSWVLENAPDAKDFMYKLSGTSMACPVAAGEAAVILSSGKLGSKSAMRVDELEKLMKSSVKIKVKGIEKNSGIVDLPTALGIETKATENTIDSANGITAPGAVDAITKIAFTEKNATMFTGESGFPDATISANAILHATITGTGKYVVTCNKPNLAKVSFVQQGASPVIKVEATGAGAGNVKITLKSENGKKKAGVTVKIVNPITSLNIGTGSKRSSTLVQGGTLPLKAKLTSKYGSKISNKKLTYTVESAKFNGNPYSTTGLTITNNGRVKLNKTIPAEVTYVIKATANDGSGAYGYFEVDSTNAISKKKLSFMNFSFFRSKRFYLTNGSDGGVLIIESLASKPQVTVSKPDIASASIVREKSGMYAVTFYGLKRGNTKVTITTADGSNAKGSFALQIR